MVLPEKDAALFFHLMWGLQFYVNQQLQLFPDIPSSQIYSNLSIKEKLPVRDALWKNVHLIDAYITQNPDGLSTDDLSVISKWKTFIRGQFYIFRYLKDYAVFIDASKVYGVVGLNERIEDILADRPLPVIVETILLPYHGKIVYDGVMQSYNIHFGGGIRSNLKEQYAAAKQNGRIITSLEPETAAAPLSRQPRKLDKENEAIAAEIVKASERMRGGTAIQNAVFGLLRASAKVTQLAVQNTEDIEGLRHLGRQTLNAFNRLQNALNRAVP